MSGAGRFNPLEAYVRMGGKLWMLGGGCALATTGQLQYLDDLRAAVPPGLVEMLRIPTLGTKNPQIQLGTPVILPEAYIADLQVRLGLYRRLSSLSARDEIDAFGMELVDRFGPMPAEVEHLLDVVEIKALCRVSGIAQLDAGPKGATVVFRKGKFANPDGLVRFISASKGLVKVLPDMKLVFRSDWASAPARLKGARGLVQELARLAESGNAAAKPGQNPKAKG